MRFHIIYRIRFVGTQLYYLVETSAMSEVIPRSGVSSFADYISGLFYSDTVNILDKV